MKEVYEFLKNCGAYYLATVEGDQPRVRPFGTVDLFEDKLYIQTGKVKAVAQQMKANPKVDQNFRKTRHGNKNSRHCIQPPKCRSHGTAKQGEGTAHETRHKKQTQKIHAEVDEKQQVPVNDLFHGSLLVLICLYYTPAVVKNLSKTRFYKKIKNFSK